MQHAGDTFVLSSGGACHLVQYGPQTLHPMSGTGCSNGAKAQQAVERLTCGGHQKPAEGEVDQAPVQEGACSALRSSQRRSLLCLRGTGRCDCGRA